MDDVLDQVDEKIGKMYETIEQKLKHVSKSFAGKFDYYEDNFKESKNQIEAMFLKVAEERSAAVQENVSVNESQLAFQMDEQVEKINKDIELNAQLQGAKIKRLQSQLEHTMNKVDTDKLNEVEENVKQEI